MPAVPAVPPSTARRIVAAACTSDRGCAWGCSWPVPWAGWGLPTSGRCSSCSSTRSGAETPSPARSSTSSRTRTSSPLHDRGLPHHHLRTIATAAAVTVTCAVIAFPVAFYMAKPSPAPARAAGRRGGHAAVGGLSREGLCVAADARPGAACCTGPSAVRLASRVRATVAPCHRVRLPLAAVHDPPDLRGPRAHPGLAAGGLRRPRRARPD